MQTFLPYPDFAKSARVLDPLRLRNQANECKAIALTLIRDEGGWKRHPAVKMWQGYVPALLSYTKAIGLEILSNGWKTSALSFVNNLINIDSQLKIVTLPPWIGVEELHASHRSNLLRKDYDYYKHFGWTEPTTLGYWWPTHHETFSNANRIVGNSQSR